MSKLQTMQADKLKWSFAQIWNESLEQTYKEKELVKRQNVWASELGGAMIDRFLKMNGVQPTNPPNARSRRKFEAGNMMEWIVELVLKRAGVLIDSQEWVSYKYEDLLEVTGKLDHLAGGKPDWEKAESEIKKLNLPSFFDRATESIIKHFKTTFPAGLETVILETKSCSTFMYDYYEKVGANQNHQLQLFHYLKAKDISEGHIVYVSKDDLRMLEIGIFNPSSVEEEYKQDIKTITGYVLADEQPPLEELITFDEKVHKFSANWKVGYSQYLTKLYGFENQMAFDEVCRKKAERWNRVFNRCVEGKNMTEANLEIIKDIEKKYPGFQTLVKDAEEKKEK